jgi:hypothetical protein
MHTVAGLPRSARGKSSLQRAYSREPAARKLPLKSEPTITADVVRGTVVDVGTAAGEIEEGAFDVGVCRRCGGGFRDAASDQPI